LCVCVVCVHMYVCVTALDLVISTTSNSTTSNIADVTVEAAFLIQAVTPV
jgi:hypothetical protein